MNFDNAEGILIGEKNKGLFAMFTMMNLERLSIGVQGVALAETSYQLSKNYALERKQGKNAAGQLTSIIAHTDIRRMLLTQRAYTEAGRALAVFMGIQLDKQYHHSDEEVRKQSAEITALLTPIAKSFFTDTGYDSCNLGLQVLGGHGYVREWGLEQLVRDAKIAQIYEGTNGIQAQDFMLRKVVFDKQNTFQDLIDLIQSSLEPDIQMQEYQALKQQTQKLLSEVLSTTQWLRQEFAERGYELQGGATSYLKAVGHLVYAWMWLEMLTTLDTATDSEFKSRKLVAASFYTQQLLPIAFEQCRQLKQGYQSFVDIADTLI
ncbi:MAG: acyl-CoA dehydrogenase [Enterobacterales bacterium]|nr:acyl-CoA dehydrogenase [Enterobacterales bacterium]